MRGIGGGARGRVWRQIMADIYGRPVLRPAILEEATSMGAAIAGGVGVGIFPDFRVAERLTPIVDTCLPDLTLKAQYDRQYSLFNRAYAALEPLFDEMGDRSILITEHRYSPQYKKEALSGKYCVQFVSFKNDERGLTALRWWRDRCLEWCYARYEDGKFGDQLYLDDWTTRFKGVHELQHLGGGMAAWNIQQYDVFQKNDTLWGCERSTGKEFPVIFYHFHYLRFLKPDKIELGRRTLTDNILEQVYVPYVQDLERSAAVIRSINDSFDPHGAGANSFSWKTPLLFLYRTVKGVYHIYPRSKFLS